MKRILSILLIVACVFCVTACGKIKPSEATTFDEIATILEDEAETYRLCDEEEIKKYEDFFTSDYNNYTKAIKSMCYAKMPDGTNIRVYEMRYEIDAEILERSFAHNYDHSYRNGTIIMLGNSPFIEEFKK